ncbi:MAG: hypothetical protein AAF490_29490, partial [Chloroflexota bacterium]
LALTQQLIRGERQTLGYALVHAKQQYFSTRANWVDYTDEKILIPMTLYGFPMLQIETPNAANVQSTVPNGFTLMQTEATFDGTAVTYQFDNLQTTFGQTELGTYFAYDGATIAQEGTPVQPYFQTEIPYTINQETARGIILRSASYNIYENFNPVIAQSWAMELGSAHQFAESEPIFANWDRHWPYELAQFDGLVAHLTNLNLVLGQFNLLTQQQRLFTDLTLEVTYSDSSDTIPPTMSNLVSKVENQTIQIGLSASDNHGIDQIIAVCDDMVGGWKTAVFHQYNNRWHGTCPQNSGQYFIQIVDKSGNVLRSNWYPPEVTAELFLPIMTRP